MLDSLNVRLHALEAHRRFVIDTVEGLPESARSVGPAPGSWSAVQLAEHLMTSESFLRLNKPAGSTLTVATSGVRTTVLNLALALPLRLKVPSKAIAIVPGDAPDFEATRVNWASMHASWRMALDAFGPSDLRRVALRHPLVGRLTVHHALDFLLAHGKHHDRQLARIVAHAAASRSSA